MKYLMLVCVDPAITPDEAPGEIERWLEDNKQTRLLGNALRPQEEAKVVRIRGGKPFVTDGPFAETKELIGGFDILECDSIEQAVEIASRHPVAKFGAIDVRPFWEGD
ncbi:MAG TPA: YciI family protein [Gaiellaceae bacterium]|nr:YciI family protein [Gaiellaceae bacterium]